jgi:hypothetical protein
MPCGCARRSTGIRVSAMQRPLAFCVPSSGDSRVLGFLAIMAIALCGLAGAPAWTVPVAAISLASLSYARHYLLFRRAANVGMQEAIDQTLARSLVNALVASTMAYGCGLAFRFLSIGWQ